MREAKDKALPVSIVSSERNSTWNTSSGDFEDKWRVQPFEIERLLPREAEDLIERLKRHSALGVLSTLTPDQQIQAFENADLHLLVALHEVTEGKPFEEIVLNECHSLVPAKAQQLYLDVCSLNQFGAPVRAGVIQRVSAIPFGHFKDTFFKPLEGVVIAEQNTYTGDFEYRARHPRVATLVFKQAYAEDAQRVEQLTRVITSLDEGYGADQEAIRQLISAHNLVKLLTDIKWGREIYERILHHLGEKWYVWHQRAVFEIQHDKGSLEDADLYAETALKLEPEKDSIQHTYAEIARRRASSTSAGTRKAVFQRQARERLGAIKKKSSYSEWSRCKLFLDELSDVLATCNPDDDASAEAVSDASKAARAAIDRTISAYPTSPEIRSVESDFFRLIQDDKKARTALERAWALSPKNAGIALNLVRIFENDGNLERAGALLDQALERHPDDHGVNLAMARFIIANNSEIDRAAYFLGRAYGASDRNYVARFLHAQFQMTVGKGQEAARLFDEVDVIAPTDYLPSWSHRRTQLAKRLGRIEGRIARKEESFAFISYPQFPQDIYANVSASDVAIWSSLQKDSRVGFEIGFNRKGPVALNLSGT
jgi:tetratricopeptide (TPR) repeat protein